MYQYLRQCTFCERITEFYSHIHPEEIYSSNEWYKSQFCDLHKDKKGNND